MDYETSGDALPPRGTILAVAFEPRELPVRRTTRTELSPSEVFRLVRALEEDAMIAIEHDWCPMCEIAADLLLKRAAELREQMR